MLDNSIVQLDGIVYNDGCILGLMVPLSTDAKGIVCKLSTEEGVQNNNCARMGSLCSVIGKR